MMYPAARRSPARRRVSTVHGGRFFVGRWFPLLFLCAALGTHAAPLKFVHLDVEDGLSHNSVYAITQDRDGFIWLGTADGLNRFDGYEFRVYRRGDAASGGLLGNSVRALLLDHDGRLWVGTERGINRYIPERDGFLQFPSPDVAGKPGSERVTMLHEDRRGVIRAGTEAGVLRFDPQSARFIEEPLLAAEAASGFTVQGIDESPDGALWFVGSIVDGDGNRLTAFRVAPGGRLESFRLPGTSSIANAFLVDREGRLWTSFAGHGSYSDGTLTPPPEVADVSITAAAELRDGSLWFGSADGLHIRDPGAGQPVHQFVDPADRSWLRNYVRAVFEDASGSVWVGTYTGVYRHDPGARPFMSLRHEPGNPDTLSGSAVSAVVGDEANLWIGTFGGGITRVHRADGQITHFRSRPDDETGLPDDVVWHLLLENSVLWVGTDQGLARLETATGNVLRVSGAGMLEGEAVRFVLRGLDGALWLGTGNGLYRFDEGSGEIHRFPVGELSDGPSPATSDAGLNVLWQEHPDELWIGTDAGHLNRLDIRSGKFDHYRLASDGSAIVAGEGVWDLLPAGDGTLWVAHGGGLNRFDPATGRGRNYGIAEGLPGSVVYSVARDAAGQLWLGTNRGLSRLDPATGGVRNYTVRDGLANMEFNRHADWNDPDGPIYFGGINGVTWFDPADVQRNDMPPPVVLTELNRFGARDIVPVNPRSVDSLVLGPHDYGFSTRFAALSYISPDQNRYAYRLLGLEERWVPADQSRMARYTNLLPGRYTFQVLGSNNDGVWSEQPYSLVIEVVPAFWETPWFYAVVILSVAGLLYAAYRYRLHQWRRLEQVRLRIASDLHDDVSSDLSGIAVAADMVSGRSGLSGEDRNLLDEVAATARRTSSALRDVVWYINPEQDTLEALIDRTRSVCNTLLADHDRKFKLRVERPERKLSMEMRRNVLAIVKEALHNIVRHADAERVSVEVSENQGLLRIVMRDDGKGFDATAVEPGHGTGSMRRRAAAIGGRLDVDSRPGDGTRVALEVDITDSRDGTSRDLGLRWGR